MITTRRPEAATVPIGLPGPAIVAAVDDSPRAARVARVAQRLAEALGARLVLAHVFDPGWIPARPKDEELRLGAQAIEDHERRLAAAGFARTVALLDDPPEAAVFTDGDPRTGLLPVAREHDARLLVVGSPARTALKRLLQGSLAAELAASSPEALGA